jgi:hypothetical protein
LDTGSFRTTRRKTARRAAGRGRRDRRSITDRTFEITFLALGAEAYCITFG